MPLRSIPSYLVGRLNPNRVFHSSAVRRDDSSNHYETLQIPMNASPGEVKKSFYALSKTHHPDHNPDDPSASKRFVKISQAYAIIGNPSKRATYDRSIAPASSSHHHHSHIRSGSYHSTNPAGGRSPSGLSRRRTQFRGPPPSFYRSGAWGQHGAKRSEAQSQGAPPRDAPPGMGYGQGGSVGEDNVRTVHFDREGHLRTGENHERRWERVRRRGEGGHDWVPSGEVERGIWGQVAWISGLLMVGIGVPTWFFGGGVRKKTLSRDER